MKRERRRTWWVGWLSLFVAVALSPSARAQGSTSIAGLQSVGASVASSAAAQQLTPSATPAQTVPAVPKAPSPQASATQSGPSPSAALPNVTAPTPAPAPQLDDISSDGDAYTNLEPTVLPITATAEALTNACGAAEEALKLFSQGSRNIKQRQTEGLKGWVAGTDPCQGWTGITCNDDNRVIALYVYYPKFKS